MLNFSEYSQLLLAQKDVWEQLAALQKPLLVYGMGNGADKLCRRCEALGIPIAGFFASDGFVRGQTFHNKKVLTYGEVCRQYSDFAVLVAFGTRIPDVIAQIERIHEEHTVFIPDLPVVDETYFDRAFFQEHLFQFEQADVLWVDSASRDLYRKLLCYKLSAGFLELKNAVSTDEIPGYPERIQGKVIDCGAYNGDTIRDLRSKRPDLVDFIAIEPDIKTFKKLNSFAQACEEQNIRIELIQAAVGKQDGVHTFYSEGNRNSTAVAHNRGARAYDVRVACVDTVAADHGVGYIKYDVEGMEREALEGSADTILRCRPILRVSAYHRSEDLFALPLLCHALYPSCRLYLRRSLCLPAWEIDLYVIPQ